MPFIIHAGWINNQQIESGQRTLEQSPEHLQAPAVHQFGAPQPVPAQDTLPNAPSAFQGRLFIWAEDLNRLIDDAQPSTASARSERQRTATNRVSDERIPSHPFQATVAQLRAWLGEEFSDANPAQITPANRVLFLPTHNNEPTVRRGSSRTFSNRKERATVDTRAIDTAGSTTVLARWQITGLSLPPFLALQFLSQLGLDFGDNVLRGGGWHRVQHGKDLQFWSHAAKLALEILTEQQYVPALRPDREGNICAIWQPVLLNGKLQERFTQLVAAMPPLCRAYDLRQSNDAPSAQQLVTHFIAILVDAAVQRTGSVAMSVLPQMQQQNPVIAEWMRALNSTDRRLRVPPQLLYRFYEQWQSWLEQLQTTADALFRACFVLEAPDPLNGSDHYLGWYLGFELQACDNASLRISAAEIWQTATGSMRVGNRRLDRPQDRLLAGLGAAARLFTPIAESLRTAKPERAHLTTAQAYHFLREIGPLLESIGFGVIYPTWWNSSERSQLGLRLRMSAPIYAQPESHLKGDRLNRDDDHAEDKSQGRQRLSKSKINYSWDLTIGNKALSQADFDRIADQHTPLLWLDDRWVELDPQQIQAARRFINERAATGQLSFLQSLRLLQGVQRDGAVLLPTDAPSATLSPASQPTTQRQSFYLPSDAPTLLPLQTIDVDGWLLDLLHQLRNHQPPQAIQEPPGFVGELRPYQERGVGWLDFMTELGLGVCLADDMGLGKTVQAIALLLHERQQFQAGKGLGNNSLSPEHVAELQEEIGENGVRDNVTGDSVANDKTLHTPALIICPTSVLANWRHEIERFAPSLRVLVHHGNNRLASNGFSQIVREHDVIITSFGTARRDIELLQQWTWSHLILDEAQNIKNPAAKQSQAVRAIDSLRRIALTGTPVENRLAELWSILDFLNPGYLEGFERFRQRYVVPIERYNDEESAGELRRLVQPFFLRRVKSDPTIISDLPEKQEMIVYCTLTEEQAALYEKTVRETLNLIDNSSGIQRRGQVLALLTKLKQIANHPAHYLKQAAPLPLRSGKLERLTEMLEEAVAVGDHALVFTQFVEMGTLLQRHLSETLGVDVLFLHGGTPANQRDRMVQAFQSEDGPPIFVLSLRAGGSGLNLTRANHVFHFDRWWNPAVENQATDRAFRIGQKRNVLVHKFVAVGTLEERIQALLESKQALADSIVGSGEEWLTEMSTDELREMITLRREMVEEL